MNGEIKGLVGGIQKFSTDDGPGIRTTVFLKGCPLSCKWCHNPELIDTKRQLMRSDKKCIGCGECVRICPSKALSVTGGRFKIDRNKCTLCFKCTEICYASAMDTAGKYMTVDEVMNIVCRDKGFYDNTGGGVTISGGELLFQHGFANSLADACLKRGISVVIDTSGYGKFESFYELACKSANILYDMKLIDDRLHKKMTGVSNQIILDNLKRLATNEKINTKIIMRMPLIHRINDTEEVIDSTCRFYVENRLKSVTLLPYHELGVQKGRNLGENQQTFETPPPQRIQEIKELFEHHGMSVTIPD